MQAFTPEQLNFFKLTAIVVDEFPAKLRETFILMWDHWYAIDASIPKWNDSKNVYGILINNEGGVKEVPMFRKPLKKWDSTALFRATLNAKTFAVREVTGDLFTLDEKYVKPRALHFETFHSHVVNPKDFKETVALALDQLRLIRNSLFHSSSTKCVQKETFDFYIELMKDAFTALKRSTAKIEEIGNLGEEDFPTSRQKQLEDELERENDVAILFGQIEDHLYKIKENVTKVNTDLPVVKTELTRIHTEMKNTKTELAGLKTEVININTRMIDGMSKIENELRGFKEFLKKFRPYMQESTEEFVLMRRESQKENSNNRPQKPATEHNESSVAQPQTDKLPRQCTGDK